MFISPPNPLFLPPLPLRGEGRREEGQCSTFTFLVAYHGLLARTQQAASRDGVQPAARSLRADATLSLLHHGQEAEPGCDLRDITRHLKGHGKPPDGLTKQFLQSLICFQSYSRHLMIYYLAALIQPSMLSVYLHPSLKMCFFATAIKRGNNKSVHV